MKNLKNIQNYNSPLECNGIIVNYGTQIISSQYHQDKQKMLLIITQISNHYGQSKSNNIHWRKCPDKYKTDQPDNYPIYAHQIITNTIPNKTNMLAGLLLIYKRLQGRLFKLSIPKITTFLHYYPIFGRILSSFFPDF